MSEHAEHIVPDPDCTECALAMTVTPADVKRWIREKVVAAGGDPADAEALRAEVNAEDSTVVDITLPPVAMYSVVVLRPHDT